jgi:hypothetical protein
MNFEYKITYIETKLEMDDKKKELTGPLLSQDVDFIASMNNEGSEGWELINVSPVLAGVTGKEIHRNTLRGMLSNVIELPYAYAYSIIRGYYLFWKRSL